MMGASPCATEYGETRLGSHPRQRQRAPLAPPDGRIRLWRAPRRPCLRARGSSYSMGFAASPRSAELIALEARYPRLAWGLAVVFFVLAALPARSAHAQVALKHWSFERPSYGGLTRNIADDYLVKKDGLWHLFYTNLYVPGEPVEYIGHAVSADLINWTEHTPPIIASPDASAWRGVEVWAPMIVDRPGGGWIMAYTGLCETGAQRMGFMTSNDFETWTPFNDSLPFEPDSIRYAWSATTYSSARDPHLVLQNGVWHLLYCARTADGVPAIGHAESPDLINWTHDDPLLTQGAGWQSPELESPGVTFFGGKTYLFWSYAGSRVAQGASLTSDWNNTISSFLESHATAPELVPSGNGLLFSRRRISPCNNFQTYLWFDSLNTQTYPFQIIPRNPLSGFTAVSGSAYSGQPAFGDGPSDRGEVPADPDGLYWLSSREDVSEPYPPFSCGQEKSYEQMGTLASDLFILNGDSLSVSVQGANSPDSAYVLLRDECTGTTIVRFTGGTETLVKKSAWVGNARGRTVSWRISDQLTRPGGWIGADDLAERASSGLGNP